MRVVLVDDEETIRRGTMLLLQQLEREIKIVGEAEDGQEGLDKIKLLKPDVAFIDIRMPLLDGLEMIRLITEQGISPGTSLVLVTAHSEFEYAQKAVRYGVKDFLLKPLDTSTLEELFARLAPKKEAAAPAAELGKQWMETYIEASQIRHETIISLLRYLAANYMKDIQLSEIAEELRLSPAYASQLFKKVTGSNFVALLQDLRIEVAKSIMSTHDYKINEVAYMVGFNDLTYFGRVFKTKTGLTPNEYVRKKSGD